MVYRQTQAVLDRLAAKREDIIAATLKVITRDGGAFTMDRVRRAAGVSVGNLYNFFPDWTELLAAAVASRLQADITAMANAQPARERPLNALARAIAVYVHRTNAAHGLMATITAQAAYRVGIVRYLEPLIAAARGGNPEMLALGLYGALNAVLLAGPGTPGTANNAPVVVAMALRMAGLADPAATVMATEALRVARAAA